jgi:hypothetical protein
MQGGVFSINKFGRMCVKNNLPVKSIRFDSGVMRGFEFAFTPTHNIRLIPIVLSEPKP